MCDDCKGFYQQLARHRQKVQVVTDPHNTWLFRTDGTVERQPMGPQ